MRGILAQLLRRSAAGGVDRAFAEPAAIAARRGAEISQRNLSRSKIGFG